MGFFAKILRPQTEKNEGPLKIPMSIDKPRVMGNGMASNKENIGPIKMHKIAQKNGRGGGKGSNNNGNNKKRFWKRKKDPAPAPKLSIFLQQQQPDDTGSIVTASMTASLTSGSLMSGSKMSISTKSSKSMASSPGSLSPLHEQEQQSKPDVAQDAADARLLRSKQPGANRDPRARQPTKSVTRKSGSGGHANQQTKASARTSKHDDDPSTVKKRPIERQKNAASLAAGPKKRPSTQNRKGPVEKEKLLQQLQKSQELKEKKKSTNSHLSTPSTKKQTSASLHKSSVNKDDVRISHKLEEKKMPVSASGPATPEKRVAILDQKLSEKKEDYRQNLKRIPTPHPKLPAKREIMRKAEELELEMEEDQKLTLKPLPSEPKKRPSTPHPKDIKTDTLKPSVQQKDAKKDRKYSWQTEGVSVGSLGSSVVVFDDLDIDYDSANEDLLSTGSSDENSWRTPDSDSDTGGFLITNIKSLALLSPLSSVNSLSKEKRFDNYLGFSEPEPPRRTSTGEFAVVGSSHSKGKFHVHEVSDLQDIIDEVERDMMELDSIFKSDSSEVDDLASSGTSANWASDNFNGGWIANGALREHVEEDSSCSFNSDDFAEDDAQPEAEQTMGTSFASFKITTIVEECEEGSEDDPLEAALKRGEFLSHMDDTSNDSGLPSLRESTASELSKSPVSSLSSADGSGTSRSTSLKEATDSDLSYSYGTTTNSTSPVSSLSSKVSSLSSGSSQGLKKPAPPKRGLSKTVSWKKEHDVYTYELPLRSVNLQLALEMVRSYDPRYANTAKPFQPQRPTPPPPLKRGNAQKPLQSILKTSGRFSAREVASDDSSLSQESSTSHVSSQTSSSTLVSNATTESVQYMVDKLKRETRRRRRKVKHTRQVRRDSM